MLGSFRKSLESAAIKGLDGYSLGGFKYSFTGKLFDYFYGKLYSSLFSDLFVFISKTACNSSGISKSSPSMLVAFRFAVVFVLLDEELILFDDGFR